MLVPRSWYEHPLSRNYAKLKLMCCVALSDSIKMVNRRTQGTDKQISLFAFNHIKQAFPFQFQFQLAN